MPGFITGGDSFNIRYADGEWLIADTERKLQETQDKGKQEEKNNYEILGNIVVNMRDIPRGEQRVEEDNIKFSNLSGKSFKTSRKFDT